MKNIFIVWAGVSLLLFVSACSHLHVDTADTWSAREIETVAYVIKDVPDSGADALVREHIQALGWKIVPQSAQADVLLETEFAYKTDLNSESEMVRTLDSVHLRVQDGRSKRTQAVSDYFYAHGKENEWEEGITAVFKALNADNSGQHSLEKEPVSATTEAEEAETTETTETTEVARDMPLEAEPAPVKPSVKSEPQIEDVSEPKNVRSRSEISEAETVSEPESVREPESMEKSPWVPRFQGWGLEAWQEGTE